MLLNNQIKMGKTFIFTILLLSLLVIPLVNASISCTPNAVSVTGTQGVALASSNIVCTNSDANSSVTVSKIGSHFNLVNTPITFSPGEANKQITINFDSSISSGSYSGLITFSNTSNSIPISLTLNAPIQSTACGVTVFPMSLSNIKVKQGETKTRNIQLSVPSCFSSTVRVQGVSLQTDEKPIQLGELATGVLNPGDAIFIPIEIDAQDVSTGQYSDTLQLLLYNSSGNPIPMSPISISVLVTFGVSPTNNFSLSELPTCSLNAIEMNLNTSYKLTCTNANPNVQISSNVDSQYIKGLNVEMSGNQYIYSFQPIKLGTTVIKADYKYQNSQIGTPFEQEVRISSSGSSPVSGTTLKFDFYQGAVKLGADSLLPGTVTVLVLDNKTNGIVPSFRLLLNGVEINNTFTVEADKSYELRADANGYSPLVQNLTVRKREIQISILPDKTSYLNGEIVNITTKPENATLKISGVLITSPYTLSSGNHVIAATKDGYLETTKNVSVGGSITYLALSPLLDDWSKGDSVSIQLSENSSWIAYKDGVKISEGNGNIATFEITDYGTYTLNANDSQVLVKSIAKKGLFSNYNFEWWHLLVLAVIGFGAYYLFFKKEDTGTDKPMVFNMGDTT